MLCVLVDALLVIASKYSNILPLLPPQNLVTSFPLKNAKLEAVRKRHLVAFVVYCPGVYWAFPGSEKVGLKLNIQKTKIMASGPITSWQVDGEILTDFILGGSKITADGDCSHEIKRCFLLGRKAMINLDSILKSKDITLPTKVRLVKAMVFPVVMYGCESWTIKKAEHRRMDAFELWCCRRLLRVPWTARRSNHSILKEISPEYSLGGLMLKLKLQCFGHLM